MASRRETADPTDAQAGRRCSRDTTTCRLVSRRLDNDTAWRMALDKLAAFVEAGEEEQG